LTSAGEAGVGGVDESPIEQRGQDPVHCVMDHAIAHRSRSDQPPFGFMEGQQTVLAGPVVPMQEVPPEAHQVAVCGKLEGLDGGSPALALPEIAPGAPEVPGRDDDLEDVTGSPHPLVATLMQERVRRPARTLDRGPIYENGQA
jgi:hypothetical protein